MSYSLARATLWNLAGYFYLIIASLISTPILVRHLGLSTFAQYGLLIATLSLVSALNLGLPQAVTRALARHHDSTSRQALWATSSLLFILTGFIGGVISFLVLSTLHVAPLLISLIFAITLTNNLLGHYATLPQAEGHFGYFNAKTFIVGTGNTLLSAFLAWKGQGITVILSSQLLCYLLTLLPLAFFSLKHFPRPWSLRPSFSVAQSLLRFGLKNQMGTLVGQVQSQYAKYLLVASSPLSLSAYLIAQGLVQKLAGGVSQVASALYPLSSRGDHHRIVGLYHALQLTLFLIGISGIGVYHLLGLPFLTWWLGVPQLVTLVDSILKVFVWYFAILVLSPLASSILDGHGRPELTSLIALLTTAIEITLALLLFPHFGLLAPVYASLIALTVMTPVLLYLAEKVLLRDHPPNVVAKPSL